MSDIDIIDHHIIIRETIGYDGIKQFEEYDIPSVMQFLRVVYNYNKMCSIDGNTI